MSIIRAFVAAILTQQTRDRTSLFFMIILPIAIIVIIGATFGGPRELEIVVLGDGPQAEAVTSALAAADDVAVERRTDLAEVRADLRRFDIEGALVVRSDGGYDFIANELNENGFAARAAVQGVIDRVEAGVVASSAVPITTTVVGDSRFATQGAFALTSAQNLVLFTFITALTAAVILVRMRVNGVLRRSLASPASATAVIVGVGAGWLVLALVQTAIIISVGALAFGVDWGDPLAALALTLLFALVGTGAGLLTGAVLTSEDVAGSATAPLALVLAAVGGCMVPTEVFPDSLVTVSKFTPHYWALEGWKELLFDNASVADIATNLAVLAAFAVGLVLLSGVALRRSLTA